jgi:uncharacterized membrane protein YkoI
VPDGRPFSLGLRDAARPVPVWYGRVVTPDGTVHEVRMDAVRGRVLGESVPAGQSASARARAAALTARARLLPSEAVNKVKEPGFGKVTQIELTDGKGESGTGGAGKAPVWRITVAALRRDDLRTYRVDAVTGEVLSGEEGGPAATPTVPPPSTALPTLPSVSPPALPTAPPRTPAPYRPSP